MNYQIEKFHEFWRTFNYYLFKFFDHIIFEYLPREIV